MSCLDFFYLHSLICFVGFAANVWDPLSTSQTSRFVYLTQRICYDYYTVHGESKNTQVSHISLIIDNLILTKCPMLAALCQI